MASISLIIFGCSNSPKSDDETKAGDNKSSDTTKMANASSTKYDYPYTLDHPYADWQPGDKQHAVNVMKSLKAFENGDIPAAVSYFGDSVDVRFDGYRAKLSKDSLLKMFTKDRGEISAMQIKMGDWESVISTDKSEEYVTLWYKQIMTDKKGKTDSLAVVDDIKIENGKIVELDEKIQHFPKPGKKM